VTDTKQHQHHDLQTVQAHVADLHTYHRNARQGDIGAIAVSLNVNGQYRPIVVNRGTHTGRPDEVLAGNHTLMAARELGWPTIAAVYVDVDEHAATRIVLADNRTADLGTYDEGALADLIRSLDGEYAGSGYDGDDLDEIIATLNENPYDADLRDPLAEVTEDDPEDLPAKGTGILGTVWELGPHRLVCGDSTDPATLDRLLGGETVDLIWTDPPYGVAYVGKTVDALTIQNDALDAAALEEFLRASLGAAHARLRPGGGSFVCSPPGDLLDVFATVLRELEVRRHTLLWVKDQFVLGRSDYHYQHEVIFYGWKPGAAHTAPPDRKQTSVWDVPRPRRSEEHPTMKPVELPARAIANHTREGDLVLDVFAGSGSVLSAAHQTGRVARMVELDPRYCDVIVNRWETLTGEPAKRLDP
jgi:DNA modification methylase